jgi:hypothetical protein
MVWLAMFAPSKAPIAQSRLARSASVSTAKKATFAAVALAKWNGKRIARLKLACIAIT